ncbi:MAG: Dickkopf N-terminal cysteine-rich domain-containing protein [Nanoarchaeota archaeon]
MNYKLFTFFIFSILLSSFSLAQTGNFSESDSYEWLNKTMAKWDKGIIDNSIALIALLNKNYDVKQGINNIKAAEDSSGCWPKGNCDVKSSAFATLALGKAGQDVGKEIKWLKESQIAATAGGTYYLQIISGAEGNCEMSCSGSTVKKTIKANSDWVDANTICSGIATSLSKSIDVDCTNLGSSVISLIYNVKAADGTDVYYISGESQESKATLSTHNACFLAKKGQSTCNYEASEYATWVLSELGKSEEIDTLNYLQGNIRANVVDYSLLYLITKNIVYTDWIKSKQKPSGSIQDDVRGTAFAVLALKQSTADYAYYNNATIWLEKKRSDNYSWNTDVFNTAIVLIAFYGKLEQVAVSSVTCATDADCPLGKYCDNTTKTCFTKIATCAKDTDCASNEVCDIVTKTCKAKVAVSCTVNADCAFGQICSNGACVQEELGCTSDIDCAEGETCDLSTGQCISAGIKEECTVDSDCLSNEQCINNTCVVKEKKAILGVVITVIIILAVLALIFLLYYTKYIKKGRGFKDFANDIKNLFKKKPKKPTFEEFLKAQPRQEVKQPLLPERPPRRTKYEGKIEDELEKSIREAERILHGK